MALITTDNFQSPTQIAWAEKMLSIPVPNLIHGSLAMERRMPKNSGYIYRMSRTSRLANAMVPLGPTGITPPPSTMNRVDIDAKIEFYGNHMILNEQVTLLNTDPVTNQAVQVLGIQLRTTEDALTRDALGSTASYINCTGGVNGDSPTEITRSDISNVVKALLGNNAKTIASMIPGENKIGTGPVRNAYIAMCHSDLSSELQQVPGFLNVANYPAHDGILDSEWGTIDNVRYLISSEGYVERNASGLGADVYSALTCGMEAYGIIKQDGYTTKFIHRPAIYDSPLALNDSLAWKMATAIKVTNDQWIFRHRCTLSV